ncbi:DUF6174 domain-containing protein [Streptomyces justiciae]|uniref:DUF6174 domain-containing protein n=1 Tax=Streptomyces justiciae TaxID=2780140 RepID=UPI00187FC78A|nr:DUF6174 domain-containing protein [Streptomyces justiciae]MBE8470626.1 hypothetical protein [Streptomyces justiciae]
MTVVRTCAGLLATAGLICAVAACGAETSATSAREEVTWEEPASYSYTLRSSEGERSLIGRFRVTVRDGKVTEAVGLDDSARRFVARTPEQVPTLGALLGELEQARSDDADIAEAEYAADGHPERIFLDRDENAVDDEARYVVESYEPA